MIKILSIIFFLVLIISCNLNDTSQEKLPIYGNTFIEEGDTIYHTIDDFKLLDQDSALITNETLKNNVYVADFFFTSCLTICPTMKAHLFKIYDEFKSNDEFVILSHTIDPAFDTIPLLKDYADKLGVSSERWKFLWGEKEYVYELAENSYMSMADEAPETPDGFIHSGSFLLVDKSRRIRGVYDGTDLSQVDILINDIERLLKEYDTSEI